eukprot:Skav227159  [mRNA]  locus=scaffold502:111994:114065:- [translate_table: standard]
MDPKLIEERIHPYGKVDLGEVPFAMSAFARRLGVSARNYCHGSLEQLAEHLRKGCVVMVMINYGNATGHLLNLLGVDRDVCGRIVTLRLRNPWGFDETMPAEEFLREWHCMRQSRKSRLGRCLPVFDAGYLVIAPDAATLPEPSVTQVLHSAPVDVLVTAVNGIGGSLCTISAGHRLVGILQLLGNCVATVGALGAYVLGNLLGLNLSFLGHELRSSMAGRTLEALGGCLSLLGGLWATSMHLLTWPLRCLGEAAAARDALQAAQGNKTMRSAIFVLEMILRIVVATPRRFFKGDLSRETWRCDGCADGHRG